MLGTGCGSALESHQQQDRNWSSGGTRSPQGRAQRGDSLPYMHTPKCQGTSINKMGAWDSLCPHP